MKHIFELRMKDQIEERSSQLLRNLSSCEKKAWKKFKLIFHPQFKYMFHKFTFIYSSILGDPGAVSRGRTKWRDESFQERAEEPLGTKSHRTISKRLCEYPLLIGQKKSLVLFCPIRSRYSRSRLEMVRWDLVPRGSSARSWKLSSRHFARPRLTAPGSPRMLFILHGYITNSQYDQLPVGLIAQLVEHCTGIAEVMGSNPVQAWIFFRLSFRNCLSCVVTARIFLLFEIIYIYIKNVRSPLASNGKFNSHAPSWFHFVGWKEISTRFGQNFWGSVL